MATDHKVNGAGAASGVRLDIGVSLPVSVECPNCGTPFTLAEGVIHDIELAALERQAGHVEDLVIRARRDAAGQARQEVMAEMAVEITPLRQENAELKAERKALHQKEIDNEREKRKVQAEREAEKLANERWRTKTTAQIRAEEKQLAVETAAEEARLKDIAHEKTINDLKSQNAAMKRKLEAGSQQLQGEVGEIDLEQVLQAAHPTDEITPVKKGAHGADVVQKVYTREGGDAGKALYESKTGAEWSENWVTKAQTDMATAGAHFGVIVSRVLPKGVRWAACLPGGSTLWVAEPGAVPAISIMLRSMILHAHTVASQNANQKDHDRAVGEYIRSPHFRNKAQTVDAAIQDMALRIARMRNYTTTGLNALEQAVTRLSAAAFGIIGDFQGLTGTEIVQLRLEGDEARDETD